MWLFFGRVSEFVFNVSSTAKVIKRWPGSQGLESYRLEEPGIIFDRYITYICMYQNQIILQGKMIGMQKYDENHLVF